MPEKAQMSPAGVGGAAVDFILNRPLPWKTLRAWIERNERRIRGLSGRKKGRSMGKLWLSDSNGCWIEIFPEKKFKGRAVRLHGPADYPFLRIREGKGPECARSLKVGPNAYIQCYEDQNFYDSVFWLLPNQLVEDLEKLSCGEQIDSLRIYDRPPFAHEPGYAAYMLWAANHVAAANSH